jgi:di/tricarboxylate transporter
VSIHAIGVIGLAIIFLVATLRPVNLGALALVMTYIVGSIFVHERPADMYGGFPVDLFLLLVGVTWLFAIAEANGTVERIVSGAASLVQGRRPLIPWIVFVVASLPAMAGALGSAGVAMLAPISLRLARRYAIDRRMIGLMVVHGAAAGNFSPLNVLSAIVTRAVEQGGLTMSATALLVANLVYNTVLAVIIFLVFGGWRLGEPFETVEPESGSGPRDSAGSDGGVVVAARGRLRTDQLLTLVALLGVAVGALAFGLSIGFLSLGAAALVQLSFPSSSRGAEKRIAWSVVLLVCGVITYVAALQRYGTVQAVGDGIAALRSPLFTGLLLCAVAAMTSAFASSAGILGAMVPLAIPFLAQGLVGVTGLVVALAISATVVDSTPFSTVGALVVANTEDDERAFVFRGMLLWGLAMVATAPVVTWLAFILTSR